MIDNLILIKKIYVYFDILKDINVTYFELVEKKSNGDYDYIMNLFYKLSCQICRIIPMKYKKLNKDGILQLEKCFDFLYDDYNELFEDKYSSLIKLNEVRNKYEHEPHNICWANYFANNSFKEMHFSYIKNDIKEKKFN